MKPHKDSRFLPGSLCGKAAATLGAALWRGPHGGGEADGLRVEPWGDCKLPRTLTGTLTDAVPKVQASRANS